MSDKLTEKAIKNGTTFKARRRELQRLTYQVAVKAGEEGDGENFAKLVSVFERMYEFDVKQKAAQRPGGDIPADIEEKRAALQKRLENLKGKQQ